MNQEEYERLQEKVTASGQTQQSFIINALAGVVIAPREEIDVLKNINKNFDDLFWQIRGMATNVNQMAHIAEWDRVLANHRQIGSHCRSNQFASVSRMTTMWQSIRQSTSQQDHMMAIVPNMPS